jgi:hypothetical protein
MTTILLIFAAVALLGGKEIAERAKALAAKVPRLQFSWQQMAAAGLLIAALVSFNVRQDVDPIPPPTPPAPTPDMTLSLDGLFSGPTAAEDSLIIAALTGELADEIAWDGTQEVPFLKTGVALDDLRQRARELRCRGVSIGARQPAARDAIAKHLQAAVGTSGGPITPAVRDAWVKAMREVSEAAADVTQ